MSKGHIDINDYKFVKVPKYVTRLRKTMPYRETGCCLVPFIEDLLWIAEAMHLRRYIVPANLKYDSGYKNDLGYFSPYRHWYDCVLPNFVRLDSSSHKLRFYNLYGWRWGFIRDPKFITEIIDGYSVHVQTTRIGTGIYYNVYYIFDGNRYNVAEDVNRIVDEKIDDDFSRHYGETSLDLADVEIDAFAKHLSGSHTHIFGIGSASMPAFYWSFYILSKLNACRYTFEIDKKDVVGVVADGTYSSTYVDDEPEYNYSSSGKTVRSKYSIAYYSAGSPCVIYENYSYAYAYQHSASSNCSDAHQYEAVAYNVKVKRRPNSSLKINASFNGVCGVILDSSVKDFYTVRLYCRFGTESGKCTGPGDIDTGSSMYNVEWRWNWRIVSNFEIVQDGFVLYDVDNIAKDLGEDGAEGVTHKYSYADSGVEGDLSWNESYSKSTSQKIVTLDRIMAVLIPKEQYCCDPVMESDLLTSMTDNYKR